MVAAVAPVRARTKAVTGIIGVTGAAALVLHGVQHYPDLQSLGISTSEAKGNYAATVILSAGFVALSLSAVRIPIPPGLTSRALSYGTARLGSLAAAVGVLIEPFFLAGDSTRNGSFWTANLDAPLATDAHVTLRPWYFVLTSAVLLVLLVLLCVSAGRGALWIGVACALALAAYVVGVGESTAYFYWSIGTALTLVPATLAALAVAADSTISRPAAR